VTNPDKVLLPKADKTKRDFVDYYIAVGDGIVRTLTSGRPSFAAFRTASRAR
jgi:DNA primase